MRPKGVECPECKGSGVKHFTSLKELRKFRGLKQEDVAKELGIKRSAYSMKENAYTQITLGDILILKDLLQVDIETFVFAVTVDLTATK